jgi:uncharacterized protein YigE (DUF2233 family)
MAMNGGIYAKSLRAAGAVYRKGRAGVPLNRASGGGNFFIRPGGVFYLQGERAKIVSIDKFKPSPAIAMPCSPARC